MSEQPTHDEDRNRWEDLRRLGEADPKLLELTVRARDALNDLAAYMAEKALDAGAVMPEELQKYVKRLRSPKV